MYNMTLKAKHVNNASAYRTISAQNSGNFFNVDNITENGNYLSSLIRFVMERTVRYKVMHASIA